MERVPTGLARDRLEDVRVDLRQRVVARDAAERVRAAAGSTARVVERVAGLVEEGLVVGEATLRARDQVDDLRRVGGDHAGPRALLRPVLEVEADVRDRLELEPERAHRLEADLDGALTGCTSTRAATAVAASDDARWSAAGRAPGRASARTSARVGARTPSPPSSAAPRSTARARAARSASRPRCGRRHRARPRARPRDPRGLRAARGAAR